MIYTQEEIAANRAKWVEALRSGKYAQTTGHLQQVEADDVFPAGYCCLGVACEIFGTASRRQGKFMHFFDRVTGNWATSLLPTHVAKMLGISPSGSFKEALVVPFEGEPDPDGWEVLGTDVHDVTVLNDTYGWTFNQIADLIESGKFEDKDWSIS